MAELEFDGDASKMSEKDKKKMLRRLSQAPETAAIFQSDKALEDFVQNKYEFENEALPPADSR